MLFIGREHELKALNRFVNKKSSSLLVVKGRRRIGKSRLIEEFAKPYKFYSVSGIAPTEKTTAQSQMEDFSNQLNKQGFPNVHGSDHGNSRNVALRETTPYPRSHSNRILSICSQPDSQ